MNRSVLDQILEKTKKKASAVANVRAKVPEVTHRSRYVDEEEDHVNIGMDGLLAASEKLLAINRGLDKTDERDSLVFKRVYTTDKLMSERVKMDDGRVRQAMLPSLARHKSLKTLHPFAFDTYIEKYLLNNPLSAPLEEINPLHLVEQSRRSTLMGPGGIGSDNAITEDMQATHASQFGYLDPLSGPECFDAQSEVYTKRGWVSWPEVKDDDIFACRVGEVLEWHTAERIIRQPYKGPMLCAESKTFRMCVTPNHRVLYHWGDGNLLLAAAENLYGKSIKIPIRHSPQRGKEDWHEFSLSEIEIKGNAQKVFKPFSIGDWCEYIGWFLSEGNLTPSIVNITQCPKTNQKKHQRLVELHRKMNLVGSIFTGTCEKFSVGAKQFVNYFKAYQGKGCYDKWIPEELFDAPIHARQRLLESLLMGDGRWTKNRMCYCTVSYKLALSVERLAIGLGYTAFIREEIDRREHVKTKNYVVSIHRHQSRQPNANNWYEIPYEGKVYCATVPGGFLHVRGSKKNSGFWSGNSEKIGIDTRFSWGTKIGSDGRIYQRFYDRKRQRYRWLSPEDLYGKTVKLPD